MLLFLNIFDNVTVMYLLTVVPKLGTFSITVVLKYKEKKLKGL